MGTTAVNIAKYARYCTKFESPPTRRAKETRKHALAFFDVALETTGERESNERSEKHHNVLRASLRGSAVAEMNIAGAISVIPKEPVAERREVGDSLFTYLFKRLKKKLAF